jgi:hypothetical protein
VSGGVAPVSFRYCDKVRAGLNLVIIILSWSASSLTFALGVIPKYSAIAFGNVIETKTFPQFDKVLSAVIYKHLLFYLLFYIMSHIRSKVKCFVKKYFFKVLKLKEFEASGLKIFACVDNDEKGKKFCIDNGFYHLKSKLENENLKDYNELLQKYVAISEQKTKISASKNEQKQAQEFTKVR